MKRTPHTVLLGAMRASALTAGLAALPLAAFAGESGIVGRTVDCASKTSLAHAHILIRQYGTRIDERHATSDGRGHFSVLGLQPGRYYVNVHGTATNSSYWSSHIVRLEANDIQHVTVGASTELDERCMPMALPHQPLTTDQTTVHN